MCIEPCLSILQATMVGTWLLELYLDQLNRNLLVVNSNNSSKSNSSTEQGTGKNGQLKGKIEQNGELGKGQDLSSQLTERLRNFLKHNVEVLDVNVTVSLLAGYGRLDDLMEYASYRKVQAMSVTFALLRCSASPVL